MTNIFDLTTRPDAGLFFSRNDPNDPRLGEVVSIDPTDYSAAEVVILGCPQDEGVRRNQGRPGADGAPTAIRREFYKLTPFRVVRQIFDLGDVVTEGSLEDIHDRHCQIVKQLLADDKLLIVLGGGNDISYPDGRAMAEAFGPGNWIAVSVDSHLDVRIAEKRNSGTPYRQLLDEGLLEPRLFYQVGFQSHLCSPVYYDYIRSLGVHRIGLDLLRSREAIDTEIKEQIRQNFINHSASFSAFFGFDIDAVRASDAPATSAPSPMGLRAEEFIQLVQYAASLSNTRVIEFSEVNPNFDVDDRTAKLVALAMHRFCCGSVL